MKWRKRTYDLDILEVFNFDSSVVIFELKEPNIWYLLSREAKIFEIFQFFKNFLKSSDV